jgi:hypothetical protein
VDFHLERRLRLRTESEDESLYAWAINEIDDQDQQIGYDQIPWRWPLQFTATSCVLRDSIEIRSEFRTGEAAAPPSEVEQRQVIQVQLRPDHPRDDGDDHHETTFSMFGTDRTIESFQLYIRPVADPGEQESCQAWGVPSHTSEIDFRSETVEDCIAFSLFVKPETFARYAAQISDGSVDEMILSVGMVSGFYSEWSPSISTDCVKVLTGDKEHKVELPPGVQTEPPRLGHVGEATLYINRRLEFGKGMPDPRPAEDPTEPTKVAPAPPAEAPASAADPQTLQTLRSLKWSARFAVILLALIFITMFFQ